MSIKPLQGQQQYCVMTSALPAVYPTALARVLVFTMLQVLAMAGPYTDTACSEKLQPVCRALWEQRWISRGLGCGERHLLAAMSLSQQPRKAQM